MTRQSDGKLVVAGDACPVAASSYCRVAVARYLPNGALDREFAGDGRLRIPLLGSAKSQQTGGVALQPDGKIVIAGRDDYAEPGGTTRQSYFVARLHTDGRLDRTFSDDGILQVPNPHPSYYDFRAATAVGVQPSGRIIVTGYDCNVGSFGDCGAYVDGITPNGAPDRSFAGGGAFVNFNDPADGPNGADDSYLEAFHPSGLAVQPDGRVVIVGNADAVHPSAGGFGSVDRSYGALARLTADGQLDATFGADGKVMVREGHVYLIYRAVTVDRLGRIVLAGTCMNGYENPACTTRQNAIGLARRYTPSGALDTTFGTAGTVSTDAKVCANLPFRTSRRRYLRQCGG